MIPFQPTRYKENERTQFLQKLQEGHTPKEACELLGYKWGSMRYQRTRYPAFKKAWDEILGYDPSEFPQHKRPNQYTEPRLKALLELISSGVGIIHACKEIGLPYQGVTQLRKDDKEFGLRFDHARQQMIETLEEVAYTRATLGSARPIVQKGQRVFEVDPVTNELILDENGDAIPVEEYVVSDRMAEILLRANKPEKYTNKLEVEANINTGVLRVPEAVTQEAWIEANVVKPTEIEDKG